jgi:hypothetical protein
MVYYSYFNCMSVLLIFIYYLCAILFLYVYELGDKFTFLLSTFVTYVPSISHHAR